MAQVIRKFLEGGKSTLLKPVIIKVDGRDINYDDLERDVWGNFNTYALSYNWDNETQKAVREYLDYVLPQLKSGAALYGHNIVTGVIPEYETDGTLNTAGKGLFKRDITNDKRAGATLGTAYLNKLFTSVIPEYKAPELKSIGSSFTEDVALKIVNNAFGGNAQAFLERWAKLSPLDRYSIFRQAISDLNYSPDEYKDVDTFNTNRAALLQLLNNPYDENLGLSSDLLSAYSKLGGWGLEEFIKGTTTSSSEDGETKIPTIEDKRKIWRQEAIDHGYTTEEAINNYIASQELLDNKYQESAGLDLADLQNLEKYESVHNSLNNYIKYSKGRLWKNYDWNRQGVNIGIEKLNSGDYYNFSNFTENTFKLYIKDLSKQLRNGKVNAFMWRGIINRLKSNKSAFDKMFYHYKNADGGCYIIPGSEDMDSESVIVFFSNGDVQIRSIHDFPEIYGNLFNLKFRLLYKQLYNIDLPDNWLNEYASLISKQLASLQQAQELLQVQQNKKGGILKALDGDALLRALTSGSSYDLESDYWNTVHASELLKRMNEVKEAELKGITVEELRKLKAKDAATEAKRKAGQEHNNAPLSFENLSPQEYAALTGLAGDITATVGSLAGGAADPVTWAGSIASFAGHTTEDWLDPTQNALLATGNTLLNLGLAAVPLIPEVGAIGPIIKITKNVVKYLPLLKGIFVDFSPAYDVLKKVESGKSLTILDAKVLGSALLDLLYTGVGARNTIAKYRRVTKPGTLKAQVQLKSESGGVKPKEISIEQYNKIKGKTPSEAESILGKDFVGDASVVEGSRRYWLFGPKTADVSKTGGSWYQRNIGNRELIEKEQVKPNLRRDWLRVQGLPMNQRSRNARAWWLKRTKDWHMPSWLSREGMTDEQWRKYTGAQLEKSSTLTSEQVTQSKPTLQTRQFMSNRFRTRFGQSLQEDSKLSSILKTIRNPQQGKRIVKKPTLLDMNESDHKAFKANDKNEMVAYLTKDGIIKWALKGKTPKSWSKRILSLNTKVNTLSGTMTIADAFANGKLIKFDTNFLKNGGSIFLNNVLLKYQSGGVVGNISSNNSNWNDLIFSKYFDDLYEGLKSGQLTIDDINEMQKTHLFLTSNYDPNEGAYIGNENNVGEYLQKIIDKYGFVNTKGINNGWLNGRYTTPLNRTYNKDHDDNGLYFADNVFGGLTDDRRILGRTGDFTDELLKGYNDRLKDLGLEIYLEGEPGAKWSYYKLRKLGDDSNSPASNNLSSSNLSSDNLSQSSTLSKTYTDPITGEEYQVQSDGTLKAIGNDLYQNKPKILRIGEDILKYVNNINPADAIALFRALYGEDTNNKMAELYKLMGTALNDPYRLTAILHGDYNSRKLSEILAGKIMANASKPVSSDAGLSYAQKLEAALKATQALQQGFASDSEMYWKTLQALNAINNENAAQEVATGNENRGRVIAAANNRLQVEASRLASNFLQIWEPFLTGMELNYRNEDTLRRLAEIDAWKYHITDKYLKMSDEVMERYYTDRNAALLEWGKTHKDSKGEPDYSGFSDYWATDPNGSKKYQKELKEISRNLYNELYTGLSKYYGYTPFLLKRAPELATPGINPALLHFMYKKGGTLSASERLALKTTNEINKNIRSASRETYKNIREDKREHRKAMALVSLLSADLIKKAVGIK